MKLQKFKDGLILSQIIEIQLFYFNAVNSKSKIWQPKQLLSSKYFMILMGY